MKIDSASIISSKLESSPQTSISQMNMNTYININERIQISTWPRMTALSAKLILALMRSSVRSGLPLMKSILGNLLIYSQISVGFSGAIMTTYWNSLRYLALSGRRKQQMLGWMPQTTIWLMISLLSLRLIGDTLIRDTGSFSKTQSVSRSSQSSLLWLVSFSCSLSSWLCCSQYFF